MTAGKLLSTLSEATGSISSVCFNPSEFVLSTASIDGFVRVYDLQEFSLITQQKTSSPDTVLFSPDGQYLLASCEESLEVYNWEPASLLSSNPVQWHSTKSLKFLPDTNKVIACSTNGNIVDIVGFRLDVLIF
jgi:katanin p80 WD40 repeat-containing subunit B1